MHQVDIVIVNWNSGDQLRQCLASITQTTPREILGHLVVVDNASSDNSLADLEQADLPLFVIRNQDNRGFAAACNQGAAEGRAEYVLFLNPDTLLRSNALSRPLTLLSEPHMIDVGICGIQLLDDRGLVARSCSRLPSTGILIFQSLGLNRVFPRWFPSQFMEEWSHSDTRTVDQVIGAFFMVRRKVFNKLGGFDERFYVYFEEVDFSLRAQAIGWRTLYIADAQAYHRGGGSSEQVKARRLFYSLQSRILYAIKHFSKLGAGMITLTTLLVEPWTRLVWSVLRLAPRETLETTQAFLWLWKNMPRILSISRQCRANNVR